MISSVKTIGSVFSTIVFVFSKENPLILQNILTYLFLDIVCYYSNIGIHFEGMDLW